MVTSRSGSAPSPRRRVAALVSLVAFTASVGLAALMLVSSAAMLVGGLAGLALVAAGGWWAVTERNPRRALGLGGVVVGLAVMSTSVLVSVEDAGTAVLRTALLVVLLSLAAACARVALVPDLHELDRRRGRLVVAPRRPVLICNPRSGDGNVGRFGLARMAEELGVEAVFLDEGLDLGELARDAVARGADCLGMAGGDGSQAVVAAVAIEHDLPFVCISAGTRNHFALDLGLDRGDPRTGMAAFRRGVERRVDYATVNGRLFVNNVSLGVYAALVQQEGYREAKRATTAQLLPDMLGREAEPFDLQLTTPDGTEIDGAYLVLVSNNPYVLGPAPDVSQRRRLDTGTLGVVAMTGDRRVRDFSTDRLEVRSRSGRALAGVDGESLELETPLVFRSHASALRVLVPEDSLVTAERRRARSLGLDALVAVSRGQVPHE